MLNKIIICSHFIFCGLELQVKTCTHFIQANNKHLAHFWQLVLLTKTPSSRIIVRPGSVIFCPLKYVASCTKWLELSSAMYPVRFEIVWYHTLGVCSSVQNTHMPLKLKEFLAINTRK